jgi:hypothetical protein
MQIDQRLQMKQEIPHHKRLKWVAMSILLFLLIIVSVTTVYALPTKMVEYRYFSDASLTNEVGFQIAHGCGGGSGTPVFGETSDYMIRDETSCLHGNVIQRRCYHVFVYYIGNEQQIVFLGEMSCP